MIEHPALDVVKWTTEPPNFEHAEYRGVKLKVIHHHVDAPAYSIGMIGDEVFCSDENMPKVCNRLFAEVDRREDAKVKP